MDGPTNRIGGWRRMYGLTFQFSFCASSGAVPDPIQTLGVSSSSVRTGADHRGGGAAGTAGPPTWVPHMEAGDEFLGTFRLSDKGLRERCCMCGSDRDELCVSLGGRGNADRVRSHLLLL